MRHPGLKDKDKETAGLGVILGEDALGKLSRYEAALLNVFNRTLHQIMLLQDREVREFEAETAARVLPAPR